MFTKQRHVYTAVKFDTAPRVQLYAQHAPATVNNRTSGRCRLARLPQVGLTFFLGHRVLVAEVVYVHVQSQGRILEFAKEGGRSLPFLFSLLFSPFPLSLPILLLRSRAP